MWRIKLAQSWLLICACILTAVGGQLCLKAGMRQIGDVDLRNLTHLGQTVMRTTALPAISIGLALYALSASLWLVVLSRMDLSYAYPLLSISYILIPLFAWLLFGEQIPPLRWFGILVVVVGVIIISRS